MPCLSTKMNNNNKYKNYIQYMYIYFLVCFVFALTFPLYQPHSGTFVADIGSLLRRVGMV